MDGPVVLFRVWLAFVFFKILLRNSIEREASNGALEVRRCHAPGTTGTAPAAKIVAIDPNEALLHGHQPLCRIVSLPTTDGIPRRGFNS